MIRRQASLRAPGLPKTCSPHCCLPLNRISPSSSWKGKESQGEGLWDPSRSCSPPTMGRLGSPCPTWTLEPTPVGDPGWTRSPETRLFHYPMDTAPDPAQQMGRAPSQHHPLSGQEEKTARGMYSGWSHSTPSFHTLLSISFQPWKGSSGSKVRHTPTCLHLQHACARTHSQSSLEGGAGLQPKLGCGGVPLRTLGQGLGHTHTE